MLEVAVLDICEVLSYSKKNPVKFFSV